MRALWLTVSEAGDPVETEFTCRTPAACPSRNGRSKRFIEAKATPEQILQHAFVLLVHPSQDHSCSLRRYIVRFSGKIVR